jgi:Xaa-Pro aminopeptidase
VMDAAAECDGYAADITRTVPASGAFSVRQREIYKIVLGAQQAVIAAVKPGMQLAVKDGPASLYRIAYNYIDSHGKDREGRSLGRYFTHGIGHQVGLDVHDADVPDTALSENMVITVEPGIYIPEENLGVRIEDMVLVTSSGAKVLSSALPKEPEAVERAISAH